MASPRRPGEPTTPDDLVCGQCGADVEAWRGDGAPGGWRYFCWTQGCYGNRHGWRKDQLWRRQSKEGAR